MRRWVFYLLFLLATLGCQKVSPSKPAPHGSAMVVSVASDGRHALSSHEERRLILWDLEAARSTVISENANLYSAFFIPRKKLFLWQDLENTVFIQSIDGKVIKSFPHFPTYGHLLSEDLNQYLSCDENWNLYLGYGDNLRPIKKDGNIPSFIGTGKLFNLTLSKNGKFFLSAGDGFDIPDKRPISGNPSLNPNQRYSNYAGVVLWDLSDQSPRIKFPGHSAKTTATLSPDGEYVVSGSENGIGRVWHRRTGEEKHPLASLFHGVRTKDDGDDPKKWYDKSNLISSPPDLNNRNEGILAFRFVDEKHYLRFLTDSPYAVLYHIDNPLPLKYLYLGRDPLPAVNDYSRNAAIDTAPETGILVMGQQSGGGIIVYKYDSETQELDRVWVADQ